MPFANWVRGELRRREWSAADLARRMDVNSGIISNWLSGKRRPSPRSCDLLADVLGADLDFVLALVGHRPATTSAPPPDETAAVIAMLRRIQPSPDRIKGLDGMLRTWLELDRAVAHEPPAAEGTDAQRSLRAHYRQFLDEVDDDEAETHLAQFDAYIARSR
jgi:transcriptional regulator with XRE-family HTH domain